MTLQDIVRDHTREIMDAVNFVGRRRTDLLGELASAEERLKRASSEITRNRTLEGERKRHVSEVERKVQDIQQKLEEIERQRTELLDRLLEVRAQKEEEERLLVEAKRTTEKAQALIKDAQDTRASAGRKLRDVDEERTRFESRLGDAYRRSLDLYLTETSKRIDQAFAGQEERERRLAALEAFKQARHEDPRIGDLCDQRDQFRQLLEMATVPGVNEAMQAALTRIEGELQDRYPGSIALEDTVPDLGLIEELYYFSDDEGKGCILLPLSEADWRAVASGNPVKSATRAARLIWDMIQGTTLKPSDGEFCLRGKFCLFVANCSAEELAALDGFNLSTSESTSLTFRFSSMPPEIQEALSHGAPDA